MKGKPLRINWEELESAFETKSEDLVYYLDLVTGLVVLEGEGEAEFDDGGDLDDDLEEITPLRRDVATRLYVEPPDAEAEADWMIAFADGARPIDPAARERLQAALDDADPMEAFREALRQHPEEREKWFLFRTDRMHDRIERWLADHGVRLAEPPPWTT